MSKKKLAQIYEEYKTQIKCFRKSREFVQSSIEDDKMTLDNSNPTGILRSEVGSRICP